MMLPMMFSCQPVNEGYTEKNTAPYKVEHYLQDIEGDKFTLVKDDTEIQKGEINTETKAVAKNYEGFTAKTVTQEKIAADGKTVVKIEYIKNLVTLTLNLGDNDEDDHVVKYDLDDDTDTNENSASYNEEAVISNPSPYTYNFVSLGKINSNIIKKISTIIKKNQTFRVALNLGKTTGLTSIDTGEFANCNNLVHITIPDGVTSIESRAFYNCSSLTSITIPDSITFIDKNTFLHCYNLTKFDVSANNQHYSSSEDKKILFNKDKTILLAYPTANDSITIPTCVTSIATGAFIYCNNLKSVIITDNVTFIDENAFYGCKNLTSVTFKDTNEWYFSSFPTYTSKTKIDVTCPKKNAIYLTNNSNHYYPCKFYCNK